MYHQQMSVASIRLQAVSIFGIKSNETALINLKHNTQAYFLIPLTSDILFHNATENNVLTTPEQMLVCAGNKNVGFHIKNHSKNKIEKRPEIGLEDLCVNRHKAVDHSDTAVLVISVDLCEPFQNGLRRVLPHYLHMIQLSDTSRKSISNIAAQIILYDGIRNEISQAMQDRLTELLFLETIDYYFSNQTLKTGFLKAMSDRRLREALSAIHDKPQNLWTVSSLARIASMSRSLFAERFKVALNETPLSYVRLCRIEKAKHLLRESTASIDQVAQESGYSSISSFVKAFSHVTGATPGSWRDEHK